MWDAFIPLTLLMVLLAPSESFVVRLVLQLFAVAGIMWPGLSRTPLYWLLLFMVHFVFQNLLHWHTADNHKWLYSYWFLTLTCGLLSDNQSKFLADNARLMLALVFLLAAMKKVITPDYLSGNTFLYLLFFDERFAVLTNHIGQIAPGDLEAAHAAMKGYVATILFPKTLSLQVLVQVLTWWTIFIEFAIGWMFFQPQKGYVPYLANGLLILFLLTVYPIAPVLGFAYILLILAMAQCPRAFPSIRMAYCGTFLVVQLFATREILNTDYSFGEILIGA